LVASREKSGAGLLISHILIDGNKIPKKLAESYETTAIVKGDLKSMSIAAASIIAKVHRDRLMTESDALYPGYGFAVHKGYGTPRHLEALRTLGVCAIHRRSFAPVGEALAADG
jgi:ribonuclease HII